MRNEKEKGGRESAWAGEGGTKARKGEELTESDSSSRIVSFRPSRSVELEVGSRIEHWSVLGIRGKEETLREGNEDATRLTFSSGTDLLMYPSSCAASEGVNDRGGRVGGKMSIPAIEVNQQRGTLASFPSSTRRSSQTHSSFQDPPLSQFSSSLTSHSPTHFLVPSPSSDRR